MRMIAVFVCFKFMAMCWRRCVTVSITVTITIGTNGICSSRMYVFTPSNCCDAPSIACLLQ